jgi:hypothetical protein
MSEVTKRLLPNDLFDDWAGLAVDDRLVKLEGRLSVAPCRALEDVEGGSQATAGIGVGEWIERVLEEHLPQARSGAKRLNEGMVQFIDLVQHVRASYAGPLATYAMLVLRSCSIFSTALQKGKLRFNRDGNGFRET